MAYPYKKMTSEDFDYIRSVTASDRVWVGDEIAKEYYRDEMPEYGVFPPELYVEVLNKEEISAIMAYAYKENIPVVCRGAGTGLAGGATCKYEAYHYKKQFPEPAPIWWNNPTELPFQNPCPVSRPWY